MKSFQLTVTKTDRRFALPIVGAAASVALLAGGAYAQEATTGAIDTLEAETEKVEGIYGAIVPAAVGSMIFGVGAIMVKRVAFA